MADNFWTTSIGKDPKRAFRFTVTMTNIGSGIIWYAKKVGKPKFSVGEAEHDFLDKKFYYPGKITWETIDLTLVDPVSPDAAGELLSMLVTAGYTIPAGVASLVPDGGLTTISKESAVNSLGEIIIEQIDSQGETLETWTLNGAWLQSVEFGELDYSAEDLTEISLTVRYDWATFSSPEHVNLFKPE